LTSIQRRVRASPFHHSPTLTSDFNLIQECVRTFIQFRFTEPSHAVSTTCTFGSTNVSQQYEWDFYHHASSRKTESSTVICGTVATMLNGISTKW
jgi:hypothetical protein